MPLPILGAVVDIVKTVLDRTLPDQKAKAEALLELEKLQQSGDLAEMAQQADINKVEAASADPFTSRWRPFIGWVCGVALGFQLVLAPIIMWGYQIAGHPVSLPVMQTELLTTLLVGMLGLGGMRTVEKLQGVAK